MKRQNNKSPFTNVPSRDEVARFDPLRGLPCCTESDFRFDVLAGPRSPWNKSVADVFTKSFMAKYPSYRSEKEVKEAWFKHAERLRGQYKDMMKDPVARADQERNHRQQERKRTVGKVCLPCIPNCDGASFIALRAASTRCHVCFT